MSTPPGAYPSPSTGRGAPRRPPDSRLQLSHVLALVSLAGISVAYFVHGQLGASSSQAGARLLFVLITLITLVWSLSVFWSDGGRLITSTGAYFLAMSVFLGLASLQIASGQPTDAHRYLPLIVAAAHFANVATWFVRDRLRRRHGGEREQPSADEPAPAPATKPVWPATTRYWVWGLGSAVFGLAAWMEIEELGLQPVVVPTAYLAMVLLVFAWAVTPPPVLIPATAALAAAGVLYLALFFTGPGRLVVGTLGLAGFMVLNMVRPRKWHKLVILVATVPALLIAGFIRAPVDDPRQLLVGEAGSGSFQQPVLVFTELVMGDAGEVPRSFDRQYGVTFVEALVSWVPRGLWEDKPRGLGSRLALTLRPTVSPGVYSMAVLTHGEWYLNFWWPGLGLMALTLGWVLARFDGLQQRVLRRPDVGVEAAFRIVVVAVVAAGLANVVWGGAATFVHRTGVSFAVWLAVYVLIMQWRRASTRSAAKEATQP